MQLNKFSKPAEQADNILERFVFSLKNMEKLQDVPDAMKEDPIIKQLFASAKLSDSKGKLKIDSIIAVPANANQRSLRLI